MKFTKMHGCGNDYVYVDCTKEMISEPSQVSMFVSDRHFGIGSDGLILIAPSETADFRMIMFNADGSEGEMCGNGIRCVGKYVYDHKLTQKEVLKIETKAGIKTLNLHVKDGRVETVRVDMGAAEFDCRKIPVTYPENNMINEPLEVGGKIYNATCVSVGNPHCVVVIDEDVNKLNLPEIGPKFENNPLFPNRINTEFINVIDKQHLKMRVWERGSGETLACGTGACASTVSCFTNGFIDSKVDIELLGGHLTVEYDKDNNQIYLTGPATEVFSGEITFPKDFEKDDVKIYTC